MIFLWLILFFFSAGVAQANTRLGLFVTSDELTQWRTRATNGPYRTAGDVSTNSPASWTTITSHRADFASNPSSGRWIAPVTSATSFTGGAGPCVQAVYSGGDNYSWPEPGTPNFYGWSTRLRDAAFYDLVQNVTTDHAALKAELLWVSSQSFTQFGNASGIWCPGVLGTGGDTAPSFGITSILTKLLFAYDYMRAQGASFTQGERDQLDRWFFDAADYWRWAMDVSLGQLYVDRVGGNYTVTDPNGCTYNPVAPYIGAPTISDQPAKVYNNRRGSIFRFTVLAGVFLQQAGRSYTGGRAGTQADLISYGKLYVQEFLRFSLFPNGYVGDMERVTGDSTQEQGWAYSGVAIANVIEIADALARAGDSSLYTYNTALGACNSAGTINDGGSRVGQNKDLLFAVQSYMKYHTGVYARYHGSNDSPTDANRINGRYPQSGATWAGSHDTYLAVGNTYFNDTFIKQAYMRTYSGTVAYPANGGNYSVLPWTGENNIFPGVLFMFGQMEGVVNPYVLTGASSVTWSNTRTGGSGTATTCCANWTISSIPLLAGLNPITVTATDANSNQGTDSITVTYAPSFPGNTLAGSWGFNEGSGTTVLDSSGNVPANNGTLVNGAALTNVLHVHDKGISLDGVDAYMNVPDANSLDFTQSFTLSAWVTLPSVVGWQPLFAKGQTYNTSNWPVQFLYASGANNTTMDPACTSGSVQAGFVANGKDGPVNIVCAPPIPTNTPTHLAVTYDLSTLRLWKNGVNVASKTIVNDYMEPTNGVNSDLQIGGDAYGDVLGGTVSSPRVYNWALNQVGSGGVNKVFGAACDYTDASPGIIENANCSIIPLPPPPIIKFPAAVGGFKVGAGAVTKFGASP